MNTESPTPPTPAADADRLVARLLGEEPAGPATDDDADDRLPAERPELRAAVVDRMFVHGLLWSMADLQSARRAARLEGVSAALVPAPAVRPHVRTWFLKPALMAAGLILAVSLGWAFFAGGPGRSPEASAAEIVARAKEKAAPENDDLEYRVTVYNDETNTKIRESSLYLRGSKWALKVGNAWMGSDGAGGDWIVLPPQREFPRLGAGPGPKKLRPAEQFRQMLEFELHQVRLAGLMEDMGKSYKLQTVARRLESPGRNLPAAAARARFTHVRGEHPSLPLRRMDVWVEDDEGIPVVVELRAERRAGWPARRMVYELVGRGRRPDNFYQESFHRPAPGRPAADKAAT